MLTRLIYASEPETALTLDTVQSLLDHARKANLQNNLTGMLAFDAGAFLQVLEGERDTVSRVFMRIAQDARHKRVLLMEVAAIDERQFGRWTMGFSPATAANGEIYLRYGTEPRFNPYGMTAKAALHLMVALAGSA